MNIDNVCSKKIKIQREQKFTKMRNPYKSNAVNLTY